MSCNNVNVGNGQIVTFGDGNIDAFGRLRVSNPLTIFDSKNIMSKNTLFDIIDAESRTSAIQMLRALRSGKSLVVYIDGAMRQPYLIGLLEEYANIKAMQTVKFIKEIEDKL